MARKPNYSFERNSRAKAKADKKEAKRLAKLSQKAGATDVDGDGDEAVDAAGEPEAEQPQTDTPE
jgi:hypothetical protein